MRRFFAVSGVFFTFLWAVSLAGCANSSQNLQTKSFLSPSLPQYSETQCQTAQRLQKEGLTQKTAYRLAQTQCERQKWLEKSLNEHQSTKVTAVSSLAVIKAQQDALQTVLTHHDELASRLLPRFEAKDEQNAEIWEYFTEKGPETGENDEKAPESFLETLKKMQKTLKEDIPPEMRKICAKQAVGVVCLK